jgi:hypothetical protein
MTDVVVSIESEKVVDEVDLSILLRLMAASKSESRDYVLLCFISRLVQTVLGTSTRPTRSCNYSWTKLWS